MITYQLDTYTPKFRIIETRFETPRSTLMEIRETLLRWTATCGTATVHAQDWEEVPMMDDDEITEALARHQDGGHSMVFWVPDESSAHGAYIVGNRETHMDEYQTRAFITGYMETSMFTASISVLDGPDLVESPLIQTLEELGFHGPQDLPDEVFSALESEAENVLEQLQLDAEAYAEALDSASFSNLKMQQTTWKQHGTEAIYSREYHGTGFWDKHPEGLKELDRWAKGLGEAGHWFWDLRDETLTFEPTIVA